VTWTGTFTNEIWSGPGTYQAKNGVRTFIDMRTTPGDVIINTPSIQDDASFIIYWDNPTRKNITIQSLEVVKIENPIPRDYEVEDDITFNFSKGWLGFTAIGTDWQIYSGGGAIMSNIAEEYFPLQVAAGNIPGYYSVAKYGQSTNVDDNISTDIWDRANPTNNQPIWVAPTQARIHNIASTSTSDIATTGVGARTIRIYGLTSWSTKEVSEDISLNGTTNVPTVNSYVIIHRIKVLTKGVTNVNVGTITATAQTDNTVTAQINPSQGQTQMAIYGWPSTQTCFITQIYAGIRRTGLATQESQADITILVNPEPNVELLNFQVKHPTMVGSRANSPFNHTFIPYANFGGPGIIKMQAIGSVDNLDVAGGFSLILVDN
jgi:hypothetical protein